MNLPIQNITLRCLSSLASIVVLLGVSQCEQNTSALEVQLASPPPGAPIRGILCNKGSETVYLDKYTIDCQISTTQDGVKGSLGYVFTKNPVNEGRKKTTITNLTPEFPAPLLPRELIDIPNILALEAGERAEFTLRPLPYNVEEAQVACRIIAPNKRVIVNKKVTWKLGRANCPIKGDLNCKFEDKDKNKKRCLKIWWDPATEQHYIKPTITLKNQGKQTINLSGLKCRVNMEEQNKAIKKSTSKKVLFLEKDFLEEDIFVMANEKVKLPEITVSFGRKLRKKELGAYTKSNAGTISLKFILEDKHGKSIFSKEQKFENIKLEGAKIRKHRIKKESREKAKK